METAKKNLASTSPNYLARRIKAAALIGGASVVAAFGITSNSGFKPAETPPYTWSQANDLPKVSETVTEGENLSSVILKVDPSIGNNNAELNQFENVVAEDIPGGDPNSIEPGTYQIPEVTTSAKK